MRNSRSPNRMRAAAITGMAESKHRFAVIIEKAEGNYSAWVPDLPGCVATGATVEETEREIREAILFHLDGMREDGIAIPVPSTLCEYVET